MVCLALMSFGMTMAGAIVILVFAVMLSMITGVPLRR
jgi:hypothetical protein